METLVKQMLACWSLWLARAGKLVHSAPVETSPMAQRARRVPSRGAMLRFLVKLYIVVVLIIQALLLYAAGELVDLFVSVVELWAELARKHLEITL